MRRHYCEDDLPRGICESCGEACTARVVDMGIGAYEYWGAREVHHDYQVVSPCCDAEVVKGGETLVRVSEHTARADHKDGKVKKGDRYKVWVTRHWRSGGPWWITTRKRVLDTFKTAVAVSMS